MFCKEGRSGHLLAEKKRPYYRGGEVKMSGKVGTGSTIRKDDLMPHFSGTVSPTFLAL